MTIDDLRELVAYQRQHARHGFGGLPPADLERLRAMHARLGYTGETVAFLLREAATVEASIRRNYGDDAAGRKLMRERGVHNVAKLRAAHARMRGAPAPDGGTA